MRVNGKNIVKRVVDVCMIVLLLFLIAYQATGGALHEWLGIATAIVLILHHALNFRWISSLFKGKYSAYRVATVVVNALLLASVVLTALCGLAMSAHAAPFLYGFLPVAFARRYHLAMSVWTFILTGLHLGLHVPALTAGFRWSDRVRTSLATTFAVLSGVGFWLLAKNKIPNYIFFRQPFAFFDYEKAAGLVLLENLAIFTAFTFLGASCASFVKARQNGGDGQKYKRATPVILVVVAVLIGVALSFYLRDEAPAWSAAKSQTHSPTAEGSVASDTKSARLNPILVFNICVKS